MANRQFEQFQYSLEKKLVHIFAKVAIGASGAPTLSAANSKGVTSITRNGAGDYSIVFQDQYTKFLMADHVIQNADGIAAVDTMGIKAVSPGATGGATINIIFVDDDAAEELENGDTLYLHFVFGNTSAL